MSRAEVYVDVCFDRSCRIGGARDVLSQLKDDLRGEKSISIKKSSCMGLCAIGPNIAIAHKTAQEAFNMSGVNRVGIEPTTRISEVVVEIRKRVPKFEGTRDARFRNR